MTQHWTMLDWYDDTYAHVVTHIICMIFDTLVPPTVRNRLPHDV